MRPDESFASTSASAKDVIVGAAEGADVLLPAPTRAAIVCALSDTSCAVSCVAVTQSTSSPATLSSLAATPAPLTDSDVVDAFVSRWYDRVAATIPIPILSTEPSAAAEASALLARDSTLVVEDGEMLSLCGVGAFRRGDADDDSAAPIMNGIGVCRRARLLDGGKSPDAPQYAEWIGPTPMIAELALRLALQYHLYDVVPSSSAPVVGAASSEEDVAALALANSIERAALRATFARNFRPAVLVIAQTGPSSTASAASEADIRGGGDDGTVDGAKLLSSAAEVLTSTAAAATILDGTSDSRSVVLTSALNAAAVLLRSIRSVVTV
jgi:hypothetical protein